MENKKDTETKEVDKNMISSKEDEEKKIISEEIIENPFIKIKANIEHVLGGISEEKLATPDIQKLIEDQLKFIQKKYQNKIEKIEAISFQTQVINGWNYWIKAKINENEIVNIFLFRHIEGNITVRNVKKIQ